MTYLWIVPIGYGLQGVLLLSNITLNVLNKPLHASTLIITQMFVLYIPLAYTGSHLFGVLGIFGAAVTANLITGMAAYLWLRRVLATEEKQAIAPIKGLPAVETT